MKFDHQLIHRYFKKFYTEILKINYTQKHVNGVDFLITCVENDAEWKDFRQVAYMFATILWETGHKMEPVPETLAKKGTRVYDLQQKYIPWQGRGYVQLTHQRNYVAMAKRLNVPLDKKPDLAMNPEVSYKIISVGMREGSFTGKKLSDYIHGNVKQYKESRRIINGNDKADKIAYYAECMETILKACLIKEEPIQVPQYIPIETQIQPVEVPQIPFVLDDGEQQQPISTTVTTKTETNVGNSSTTVEVEKNIPAPTQYIDPIIPKITSGIKNWKTAISGVLGSLGLGGAWSWITEKYQSMQQHTSVILTCIIIAAIFGISYYVMRERAKIIREKMAHEKDMEQLRIRANPALTNVEIRQ